jgi:hypothetical protein
MEIVGCDTVITASHPRRSESSANYCENLKSQLQARFLCPLLSQAGLFSNSKALFHHFLEMPQIAVVWRNTALCSHFVNKAEAILEHRFSTTQCFITTS